MSITRPFYVVGGTLPTNAPCYVTRDADAQLFEHLRAGEFCYVLNTRQIGKSSLMVRTAQRLRTHGVQVVLLDLTAIGQNVTVEEWYDGLLSLLAEQVNLRDALEEFWLDHERLGPMQRWMEAVRNVVLEQRPEPLCIFVDEIDSVRGLPFSTDEFFAGIRACYNRRVQDAALDRLNFCLLGVAAPVDLIADPRSSPFNIGRRIVLSDFTPLEIAPLATGLGSGAEEQQGGASPQSLRAQSLHSQLLHRVHYWTGGHPYLTQRLCRTLAQRLPAPTLRDVDAICGELFLSKKAQQTDDNLIFVRNRLLHNETDRAALLDLYRLILAGRKFKEDAASPLHSDLRLSGIVKVVDGVLTVRNRIYASVFDHRWARANLPEEEARRQKTAYYRGAARSATLFGSVTALIATLLVAAVVNAGHARASEERARKQEAISKEQAARASRLLYFADMGLIQSEWENDNIGHMLELLDETRDSKQRSFEWYYWNHLCHAGAQTFSLPGLPIHTAFSPDDHTLAVVNETGRLTVMDAHTKTLRRFAAIRNRLGTPLAFSPDGRRMLVINYEGSKIQDAFTGKTVIAQDGREAPLDAICFSPDGATLFSGSQNGTLCLWNSRTGRRLWRRRTRDRREVISLALSGGMGADSSDARALQLWNMKDGTEIRTFTKDLAAFAGDVFTFSHDGARFAGRGNQGGLAVLDLHTDRTISAFEKGSRLMALQFSLDDRRIAAHYTRSIRLWDVQTAREVKAYKGSREAHYAVAFSQDGRFAADIDRDGAGRIWDLNLPTEPRILPASAQPLWRLHYSPDGARLAVGSSDGGAYLWNARTGRALGTLRGGGARINTAVFSHDGACLATGGYDGGVWLWDAHTGQALKHFRAHLKSINDVVFSHDDRQLITSSDDRTAKVWDLPMCRERRTLSGFHDAVECLALSPDGALLLTASDDKSARLWVLKTGRLLHTFTAPEAIWGAAFSPDGERIALANLSNTAEVWDVVACRRVFILKGHSDWVTDVTFSPDGRRLLTGSRDNTAKLWDAETGRELLTLRGHEKQVIGVAFSPDGDQIATSSADGAVRLWSAAVRP